MVLVTISFITRNETTDFVGFVWLKISVACNKPRKKTVISNHWNETLEEKRGEQKEAAHGGRFSLAPVEGPFGRCRFAE